MAFFAYMLRCRDGSFYTGHTDDLPKRLQEHAAGDGSRHTRSRLPVTLVRHQTFATREDAKAAELRIKGWNRAKKQAVVEGRHDLLTQLSGRSRAARALRDALLRNAPQGRGV